MDARWALLTLVVAVVAAIRLSRRAPEGSEPQPGGDPPRGDGGLPGADAAVIGGGEADQSGAQPADRSGAKAAGAEPADAPRDAPGAGTPPADPRSSPAGDGERSAVSPRPPADPTATPPGEPLPRTGRPADQDDSSERIDAEMDRAAGPPLDRALDAAAAAEMDAALDPSLEAALDRVWAEHAREADTLLAARLRQLVQRGVPVRAIRRAPGGRTVRVAFADGTVLLCRGTGHGDFGRLGLALHRHAVRLGGYRHDTGGTRLEFRWNPDQRLAAVAVGLDQPD